MKRTKAKIVQRVLGLIFVEALASAKNGLSNMV